MSSDQQSQKHSNPQSNSKHHNRKRYLVRKEDVVTAEKVSGWMGAALGFGAAAMFATGHITTGIWLTLAAVSSGLFSLAAYFWHVRKRKKIIGWYWVVPILTLSGIFVIGALGTYPVAWRYAVAFWSPNPLPPAAVPQWFQSQQPETEDKNRKFKQAAAAVPEITLGCLTILIDGPVLGKSIESGVATPFFMFREPNETVNALSLYEQDGVLHANVDLESPKTHAGVELTDDVFTVDAPDWDVNRNDKALEVTDENGVVIFQLVRLSKTHLLIRGVLRGLGLASVLGERGEFGTMAEDTFEKSALSKYFLTPIFLHPEWKYPGQLAAVSLTNKCPPGDRGRMSLTTEPIVITAPSQYPPK